MSSSQPLPPNGDHQRKGLKNLSSELAEYLLSTISLLSKLREYEESWERLSNTVYSITEHEEVDTRDKSFGPNYKFLRLSFNSVIRFLQKLSSVHEANSRNLSDSIQNIEAIKNKSTIWNSIQKICDSTNTRLSTLSSQLKDSYAANSQFIDPLRNQAYSSKVATWRYEVKKQEKLIFNNSRQRLQEPLKEISSFYTGSLVQLATERREHLRSEDAFLEELLISLASFSLKLEEESSSATEIELDMEMRPAAEGGNLESRIILFGFLKLKKASIFTTNWPVVFTVLTETPCLSLSFLHVIPVDRSLVLHLLNQKEKPTAGISFKPFSSFQKWNNPQLPYLVSSYLLEKYFSPKHEATRLRDTSFDSFYTSFAFPSGSLTLPLQGGDNIGFVVSALVTKSSDTLLLKVASPSSSVVNSFELRNVPYLENYPTTSQWLGVISDVVHRSTKSLRSVRCESPYPLSGSDGWSVELSDIPSPADDPGTIRNGSEGESFISVVSFSKTNVGYPIYGDSNKDANDDNEISPVSSLNQGREWTPSPIDDPWRSP